MKMEEDKITGEELEQLEEVNVEVDEESFKVAKAECPACDKKMNKKIENKSLFNGVLTFHIIKFRCAECKKEYLDLEQAETYDLYLALSKISALKPVHGVTHDLLKAETLAA